MLLYSTGSVQGSTASFLEDRLKRWCTPLLYVEEHAVCTAGGKWEAMTICLEHYMMTSISWGGFAYSPSHCMVGCVMCWLSSTWLSDDRPERLRLTSKRKCRCTGYLELLILAPYAQALAPYRPTSFLIMNYLSDVSREAARTSIRVCRKGDCSNSIY